MKKVYINSVASIAAQKTFDNTTFLEDVTHYTETVLPLIDPNYKEFIPPAAARRMAKGIKMGVVASRLALQEANLENVEAIITGTGMGCVRDSEKFVSAIIDNNEQYLTPTSFIQSTHNTVGGQIALGLNCKGYNFTYVHSSTSFESALLDAKLMLACDEAKTVLVGGVDELGDHTVKIHRLINHIKQAPVNSAQLLESKTEGAVFAEGANFFVLANELQKTSYAEVVAVKTYNTITSTVTQVVEQFIADNNLLINDVDAVVLGCNGDVTYDLPYDELQKQLFANIPQLYYKHLCGEFNTASSFGFWLGARVLKEQRVPVAVQLNAQTKKEYKNILLYNQYRGKDHSLTLLRKC